jgi:hypothetical protein
MKWIFSIGYIKNANSVFHFKYFSMVILCFLFSSFRFSKDKPHIPYKKVHRELLIQAIDYFCYPINKSLRYDVIIDGLNNNFKDLDSLGKYFINKYCIKHRTTIVYIFLDNNEIFHKRNSRIFFNKYPGGNDLEKILEYSRLQAKYILAVCYINDGQYKFSYTHFKNKDCPCFKCTGTPPARNNCNYGE